MCINNKNKKILEVLYKFEMEKLYDVKIFDCNSLQEVANYLNSVICGVCSSFAEKMKY